MTNYEEVDTFLAHHGVPGMKWGHHKAQVAVAGVKRGARGVLNSYTSKAQASINKSGGSKSKAITKAVGKDFVDSLGLALGQKGLDVALSAIPGNHMMIRAGSAKAFRILQIANHAQGAAKIAAIATRPKSTKE